MQLPCFLSAVVFQWVVVCVVEQRTPCGSQPTIPSSYSFPLTSSPGIPPPAHLPYMAPASPSHLLWSLQLLSSHGISRAFDLDTTFPPTACSTCWVLLEEYACVCAWFGPPPYSSVHCCLKKPYSLLTELLALFVLNPPTFLPHTTPWIPHPYNCCYFAFTRDLYQPANVSLRALWWPPVAFCCGRCRKLCWPLAEPTCGVGHLHTREYSQPLIWYCYTRLVIAGAPHGIGSPSFPHKLANPCHLPQSFGWVVYTVMHSCCWECSTSLGSVFTNTARHLAGL